MRYNDVKSITGKTRFVFDSPKWYVSATAVAIISILFGIIILGFSEDSIIAGFVLTGIPAYFSALLSLGYARAVKNRYWAKTDLLISVSGISISLVLYVLALAISRFVNIDMKYALVISLSVPLWVRHMYFSSVTVSGQIKALPLSISYPTMIFISMYLYFPSLYDCISLFLASCASALFFSAILLAALDAPMRNVLGVGGLEFTRWTLEHYKEKSGQGHDRLEEIFDRFGEESIVHFDTVSFMKDGEIDAAIAVHTAHPGPVGDVGGGDLPGKLSKITGIDRLITPHGASTHDTNPTTEKEVVKLGRAIKKGLKGKESRVSEAIRLKEGEISLMAERFGDALLIVETSSPEGTEDIDPGIAMALNEKVKQMGYERLIFIDAHNSFDSNTPETKIQSPKYFEIERAVIRAAEILKDAKLHPVRAGFGQDRSLGMEDGVAGMGVQTLVLDVNGKKVAYVTIDGNNMEPGLREKILSELKIYVDHIEVMTSDNHYVNWTDTGKNPVGYRGRHKEIIASCKKSLEAAIDDMHPVKVFVAGGSVMIRVFGPSRSSYMYCVPRAIDGFGKYVAFLSLAGMLLTDILLAMLI